MRDLAEELINKINNMLMEFAIYVDFETNGRIINEKLNKFVASVKEFFGHIRCVSRKGVGKKLMDIYLNILGDEYYIDRFFKHIEDSGLVNALEYIKNSQNRVLNNLHTRDIITILLDPNIDSNGLYLLPDDDNLYEKKLYLPFHPTLEIIDRLYIRYNL